jgi:hypothetical protein
MELIEGKDLRDFLADEPRPGLAWVLSRFTHDRFDSGDELTNPRPIEEIEGVEDVATTSKEQGTVNPGGLGGRQLTRARQPVWANPAAPGQMNGRAECE